MRTQTWFALFALAWLTLEGGAASASQSDPTQSLIALSHGLQMELVAPGPDAPWKLRFHNQGTDPVVVVVDRGLLWLEVALPGQKKAHRCELPAPLRPSFVRRRRIRTLAPGAQLTRKLDPRLYCFADRHQTLLVPDARVTPHFGWRDEVKTVWRGGRRVEVRLEPKPPFVAWLAHEEGEDTPSEPDGAGLKSISGPTLVLDESYSSWTAAGGAAPVADSDLTLEMHSGVDARSERDVTVSVQLDNHAQSAKRVAFRREFLRYDVVGPDGRFTCPRARVGAPARDSFVRLAGGGKRRLTTRLIEVCPPGAFSRPGLYAVTARLRARFGGQRFGFDGFRGRLRTPTPALVRVRTGYRPFARRSDLVVPPQSTAPAEDGLLSPDVPSFDGNDSGHDAPSDDGSGGSDGDEPSEAPN